MLLPILNHCFLLVLTFALPLLYLKKLLQVKQNALLKLDCNIEQIEYFNLPIENSNRTIIKIKKVKKTSKIFPRKYNEIKNKPL